MPPKRKNLAITQDGAPYNKRPRPDTAPSADVSAKYDDSSDEAVQSLGPKNFRPTKDNQPQLDPKYGQRSAFPGLEEDRKPFLGPANDGLDYLRMVRSEARGVPSVVVAAEAPTNVQLPVETYYDEGEHGKGLSYEEEYEDGEDEDYYYGESYGEEGYYEDGAYVASASALPIEPEPQRAQDAYYTRLKSRFLSQRMLLHSTPPEGTVASLNTMDQPISCPANSRAAAKVWRKLVLTTYPSPVQLASMELSTVLTLLRLLTTRLQRNEDIRKQVSAWAWGLLGRLQDMGTLTSDQVGVVRDLGKKAVWVGLGFQGDDIARLTNGFAGDMDEASSQVGDEHDGGTEANKDRSKAGFAEVEREDPVTVPTTASTDIANEGHDVEEEGEIAEDAPDVLREAKARMMERLISQTADDGPAIEPQEQDRLPSRNTLATIDMIITIAGELYGQRDLLEFRKKWEDQRNV